VPRCASSYFASAEGLPHPSFEGSQVPTSVNLKDRQSLLENVAEPCNCCLNLAEGGEQ